MTIFSQVIENMKSRMNRDVHVRFCGKAGVKFPCLTRLAAIFTDLHFGAKSNSDLHNNDCLEFIHWMTQKAKEEGCETCLVLGDYHNNRASMNIKTMQYAVKGLEHLNDNFEQVYC
jgi:hypothetical protein